MADGAKENLQIAITPPPPPPPPPHPRLSIELTTDDVVKDQRVPFFGPIQQGRRTENTWVISLFVIFYLVAFAATMLLNDCWQNSHGDCALKPLGRISFQPLVENPLLGPSASSLDEIGALRLTRLTKNHETWRLFTSLWLHAGVFHLLINISCVIFIGIHLEQEFGPLRIGLIFLLSAISGSLVAALFLNDRPSVASSAALFGLLGAMLSGLIRNWNFYTKKFAALMVFSFILGIHLLLGLLPYVNNFSNIGGFISGLLLGFVLLFNPQLGKVAQNKVGLFDYEVKCSLKLRQKLDRPVMRSVSLVLFSLLFAGVILALLHGINVNKYCSWCQYVDCVPFKWWSCSDKQTLCETLESSGQLTLTCAGNDKFRVFPYTNLSQARFEDLCYMMCSLTD